MSDSTREHWIETESEKIIEAFGYTGLDRDEARQLAALMYDMDPDAPDMMGMRPEERIQQELLTLQGVDPGVASIMARGLDRLDWPKLVTSSRYASTYLGTSGVTLYRNRQTGRVPAMVEVPAEHKTDVVAYWIARLLYIRAWQRVHPWRGGNAFAYPDVGERSPRWRGKPKD